MPEVYKSRKNKTVNPLERALNEYPRAVRGGSYDDDAQNLRNANRFSSNEKWKMRDPQFPKSIGYNADTPFVEFRVLRQKEVPKASDIEKYWN